ncbi:MAG: hypothetical protein JSS72_00140 [Armatimonadetes bacterium]|nr:hypothetical protein [Armatimonadota bacterium]
MTLVAYVLERPKPASLNLAQWAMAIAAGIAVIVLEVKSSHDGAMLPATIGAVLGLLAGIAFDQSKTTAGVSAMGLLAFALLQRFVNLAAVGTEGLWLAMAFLAPAVILGKSRWAVGGLGLAIAGATQVLLPHQTTNELYYPLAALVVTAVVQLLPMPDKPSSAWMRVGIAAVLTVVAFYFGGLQGRKELLGICLAIALGTVFMVGEDADPGPARTMLATLMWLSACVVGMALMRRFGLIFLSAAALPTLSAAKGRWPIVSLSPVLAVALFQAFRSASPDPVLLDVTQSYVLVGLMMGALMPGLWVMIARQGKDNLYAQALGFAMLLLVPTILSLYFGGRSAIGFLIGAPFAAVMTRMEADEALSALAGSVLSSAFLITCTSWLTSTLHITRDQRGILLGFAFAAALALAWIARPKSTAPTASKATA